MFATIKQALRKARGMGKPHAPSEHALAACVANYEDMLGVEQQKPLAERDYVFMLYCLHQMASYIIEYTDANMVSGDTGAEYWLHRAVPLFYCVCDVEEL